MTPRPVAAPVEPPRETRLRAAVAVVRARLEPDYAREWLDQAERKWRTANREEHPVDKCENLQAAMERMLKALIVARGQRVRHRHDLRELWVEAEGHGESIPAQPDPVELQYPAPGIEPEATWTAMAPVGEDLLNHARRRVPALIDETRKKLERNG